jgi:hypothetical protein
MERCLAMDQPQNLDQTVRSLLLYQGALTQSPWRDWAQLVTALGQPAVVNPVALLQTYSQWFHALVGGRRGRQD